MAWIVWVGGVGDEYTELETALQDLQEWQEQGYDDAQLEEVA